MSGTSQKREKEIDKKIETTRQHWKQLKSHLKRKEVAI